MRRTNSEPGQVVLGEYVVTGPKIGDGRYAAVFKGVHKGTGQAVAVKRINTVGLGEEDKDNLVHEIQILKGLNHRNVVKLFHFQLNRPYVYLVLEYCDGGSLYHHIKAHTCLPENSVRYFLRQLANGLQCLHTHHIIHRDLKPLNLLLAGSPPVLKIADFNLSRQLHAGATLEGIRGSLLYMAPEMLQTPDRPYTAKVDLWSVGIILYEALYGRAPFESANQEDLLLKIVSAQPIEMPPPGHVPFVSACCLDLLTRLLQKDPIERIDFDAFFRHPYVDLDHYPTADSMPRARALLKKAVWYDRRDRLTEALDMYREALAYAVPAISAQGEASIKRQWRAEIEPHMQRCEQLHAALEGNDTQNQRMTQTVSPHPIRGDQLVSVARQAEARGNFQRAKDLYTAAAEAYLTAHQAATDARAKQTLRQQGEGAIKQAEALVGILADNGQAGNNCVIQ